MLGDLHHRVSRGSERQPGIIAGLWLPTSPRSLKKIHDCDRRLNQYQAVLDADADPKIVARWMAQVQRERHDLEAQLGRTVPGGKLTAPQVRALVKALHDIVAVLAEADPDDRDDLYTELGVNLTYHPEGRVRVEMKPRGVRVRVGGASATPSTRDPWETILIQVE